MSRQLSSKLSARRQKLLTYLGDPKNKGHTRQTTEGITHEVRCPHHDDQKASLGVTFKTDGALLLCCGAGCASEEIVPHWGMTMADLMPPSPNGRGPAADPLEVYRYTDEVGEWLFEVCKFPGKEFRQRRRDDASETGWRWKLADTRLVLFLLHELKDVPEGATIYLCEGEKDVLRLRSLGLFATCNPMGAGKWRESYTVWLRQHLQGRQFVIIADNDAAGRRHAEEVLRSLIVAGLSACILHLPDLPEHGDVSDWLDVGGTRERLGELAKPVPPTPEPSHPADAAPVFGPRPQIITDADLDRENFIEPDFVLKDILPQGFAILASKPKLGKTRGVSGIAIAVAEGGKALGNVDVSQGDVLFLALEDNRRRLQQRLRVIRGDTKPSGRLHLVTEWPRFDAGGLVLLREWLQQHSDTRLVIIDTVARVRPPRNRNADLYAEDYEFGVTLKRITEQFPICLLGLHHQRKGAAEDIFDTVTGSLGLTAAADTIWVLQRARGQADARLHITGRDVEEQELALAYDAHVGSWTALGDADEVERSKQRRDILQLIQSQQKPLTPKQVADTLGKNHNTTKNLMLKMAMKGELKVEEGGAYAVP